MAVKFNLHVFLAWNCSGKTSLTEGFVPKALHEAGFLVKTSTLLTLLHPLRFGSKPEIWSGLGWEVRLERLFG